MNRFKAIIFMTFLIFNNTCFARIILSQTHKLDLPQLKESIFVSKETISEILSPDLTSGLSGQIILTKVADNTVAYWWKTTPLRKTSFGRAAESIEKNARLQGQISGANQVVHRFDFKVLAMQALAQFEYTGWLNAGIRYDLKAAETSAAITQPLAKNQDLIMSQNFNHIESTSRLSFNYNW